MFYCYINDTSVIFSLFYETFVIIIFNNLWIIMTHKQSKIKETMQ